MSCQSSYIRKLFFRADSRAFSRLLPSLVFFNITSAMFEGLSFQGLSRSSFSSCSRHIYFHSASVTLIFFRAYLRV